MVARHALEFFMAPTRGRKREGTNEKGEEESKATPFDCWSLTIKHGGEEKRRAIEDARKGIALRLDLI